MQPSLHPDDEYTCSLKTRGNYRSLPLYQCGELAEYLPDGSVALQADLEKQGLLSTLITGGNPLSHSLDRYHGNWDKVSLNFTPYTPMAYHRKRAQHLCFLL